jgi:hypothetical protein
MLSEFINRDDRGSRAQRLDFRRDQAETPPYAPTHSPH